jgi:nucleoside-diphosphate-sugar epimerase
LIGTAVVRELIARGHAVIGLARSEASRAKLAGLGAQPLAGDITLPGPWSASLPALDAVIHAASDFNTDMGAIDRHLLDVLLPALGMQARRPRFIYTGGCWLFGATGEVVATEESTMNPLPAFAWMVEDLTRVLGWPSVDGIVIHPAMVHAGDGGVFRRFAADAAGRRAVRVVASEAIRWPLVHADDLAQLYALYRRRARRRSRRPPRACLCEAAQHAGPNAGDRFHRCDRGRARRVGTRLRARSTAQWRQGASRSGLAAATSGSRAGNRRARPLNLDAEDEADRR